jgi:hypothetical protein
MVSMTIEMPDQLRDWVEERAPKKLADSAD